MKQLLLLLAFISFSVQVLAQKETPEINKTPFAIGETIEFTSNILQEKRRLNIYLPASYSKDKERQYPVIYLLDGSKEEDFIHIAGLVQFGSFSWINMMPESIVVGIANVDRKRDFTFPTNNKKDKEEFPTTGASADFIKYLKSEVKPLIGSSYRVTGEQTLLGQSLGGLLATEIFYRNPNLFDNFVIVSPSLWWNDESLLAEKLHHKDFKGKVFVAVGKEGATMERIARKLYGKIENGVSEKAQIGFKFYEQQSHGDVLHLAAYDAFSFLFQKEPDDS